MKKNNHEKIELLEKKLEKQLENKKRLENEISCKNQQLSELSETICNMENSIKALKLENLEAAVSEKYSMKPDEFYNAVINGEMNIRTGSNTGNVYSFSEIRTERNHIK